MKAIRGSDFDIVENKEFLNSSEIFKSQCVLLKKEGLCQVNHHPPISSEDLQTLYESEVFSINEPRSLLRKVFFELMLHFGRRGKPTAIK